MNKKMIELRAHIFDHVFDAVIITDERGKIVDWNRSAEQLLGFVREEILRQSMQAHLAGEHPDQTLTAILDAVKRDTSWSGPLELVHRDGSARKMKGQVTPIIVDEKKQNLLWVGSDISERIQMEQRLKTLEHYDSLTGIPNWGVLYDRIEHLIATSRRHQLKFALIFLDLDNFRNINESAGYTAGNIVLRDVAQRLRHALRSSDTVGRIGSDEFVILAEDIRERADADIVEENVLAALGGAFIVRGSTLHVNGTMGTAIYPVDGDTSDELLIRASSIVFSKRRAMKELAENVPPPDPVDDPDA